MARNAFKRLRTLRHPDLLKYLDGAEVSGPFPTGLLTLDIRSIC